MKTLLDCYMCNKFILVLLVLLPFCSLSQSEEEFDLDTTLKGRLQEKDAVLDNFQANVQLSVHSEVFSSVLTTPYKMYYSKPELFRLEKMNGDREVLIVNSDDILYSIQGQELRVSDNQRMVSVINALMSQLINASYINGKKFVAKYSEEKSGYRVVLLPKKGLVAKKLSRIELLLNKEDVSIMEMKIFESDLSYFVYSFVSVSYNLEMDLGVFKKL